MWRGTTTRALVVATALSLYPLAACANALTSGTGPPKGQGTVTIGMYPWIGYDATAAVVGRILETKLGYRVVKKVTTALESWPQMESGEVDVVLENWAHDVQKNTYIDERRTVVHAGYDGNQGFLGVFIPGWMALQYPDIWDWRNLNKYAHLFRTPETGDKGLLLDSDPSYLTKDRELVRNLGLNFTVANSGSEDATVRAALAASTNHTPLMFYFWQPHWLFRQVKLAKISFPAYTPGCEDDWATVTCDYASYKLDKLVGRKFADHGGRAYEFIKSFRWSNADQNEVADYLILDKLTANAAADRWMEAHPDTWEPWLRF